MGAQIVDDWMQAKVHIVDNFESPGQRASWLAKLGGHLIATKDLQHGPWIQLLGAKGLLETRHVNDVNHVTDLVRLQPVKPGIFQMS